MGVVLERRGKEKVKGTERGGVAWRQRDETFSQTTCTNEDERSRHCRWRRGSDVGVGRKKQKQNRDCHFNEAKLFFMTKQPRTQSSDSFRQPAVKQIMATGIGTVVRAKRCQRTAGRGQSDSCTGDMMFSL